MNFVAYRKGKIGYPASHAVCEGLYAVVLEEDPDMYYTDAGFIYPLGGTGPNIADVVAGRIPLAKHKAASLNISALMITKEGAITQVDLFKTAYDREGPGWKLDFHALPNGPKTVYALAPASQVRDGVLGALAGWKDEEKFQADTDSMALCENRKIIWISVEDVIKRLNEIHKETTGDPNATTTDKAPASSNL